MTDTPLIRLVNVVKKYKAFEGFLGGSGTEFKAVNNVSLDIMSGLSLGIVGESGSGKTTLAKLISNIIKPDEGSILFKGEDINEKQIDYNQYRKSVQMVFQDPYSSLNPKLTIFSQFKDALTSSGLNKSDARTKSEDLLQLVGLEKQHLDRFPHEFSGGQRQRLSIARAMLLDPEIIVADEPVSSLDVSVQAQILNLMKNLQKDNGITFILISHDFAVVSFLCEKLLVMNEGIPVEYGDTKEIISNPKNEYTAGLLEASVY